MIEEQFVSFETAKMLKDAGFDVPCFNQYTERGTIWHCDCPENFNKSQCVTSCPTQALAARWLREVNGIHVASNIFMDSANDADGKTVDGWTFWSYDLFNNSGSIIEVSDDRYDSYEEAIEAGIAKCLELIKK